MNELDELRMLSRNLFEKTKLQKYDIIIKILSDDECFSYIDMETAIRILKDLGKTETEAKSLYEILISPNYYLHNKIKINEV